MVIIYVCFVELILLAPIIPYKVIKLMYDYLQGKKVSLKNIGNIFIDGLLFVIIYFIFKFTIINFHSLLLIILFLLKIILEYLSILQDLIEDE